MQNLRKPVQVAQNPEKEIAKSQICW